MNTMKLTQHKRHVWRDCANALRQLGALGDAGTLSRALSCRRISVQLHDRAAAIYRHWLVFGEV